MAGRAIPGHGEGPEELILQTCLRDDLRAVYSHALEVGGAEAKPPGW